LVRAQHVGCDPRYFRPNELNDLKGDCSKLKRVLGWEPDINFKQLMQEMIDVEKMRRKIK